MHPSAGEMVFPWMFEDFAALQPLKEAAELLAKKSNWPGLYNLDVLGANTVPAAGATYYEDMYVDFELAQVSFVCFTYEPLGVHLLEAVVSTWSSPIEQAKHASKQ